MNSPQFLPVRPILAVAYGLLLLTAVVSADSTFEDGPVGFGGGEDIEKAPWVEGAVELPAMPGKAGDMIEINVSTAGLPYKIYLDPDSLTTGEDRVVRYTVVMVSPSGVRNVTYEGLHCGERAYRRLAFGMDGEWRVLKNTAWQPVTGTGVNQYRKLLYQDYFCDASNQYREADELVRMLRYESEPAINDD